MLHVIGSSEGKRDLSRLRMNQLRRENTAGVAVRLLRMKRRECLAGRAQAGGHDDLSMVANAQEHPRACWHFPPRQGRSLKGRPNHATHPAPRARELIGYVSVVITTWLSMGTWRSLCLFSPSRGGALGFAQRRREAEPPLTKQNDRRSTREGARRGRAGVMRAVAAVRTFGLCGT